MHSSVFKYCLLIPLAFLISCSGNRKKMPVTNSNNSNTQKQLLEANRVLVKKDRQRIVGFLKRQNWEMTESNTGLWYEILEQGSGDSVKVGDFVSMNFTLKLLDGTIISTSEEEGVKAFEVGHGGVESGLEQAVLYCKNGTNARFILPPHLGYGLPGDGQKIPARAILLYEIEIVNLVKK